MKISVIFTGGTIGTTVKDGWMTPDENTRYTLLETYKKENTDVSFETSAPYTILSENLSAKELNLLISEIERALLSDCDGIIVTHGTDTLQYSAIAAEYAFNDCNIPVLFVSAAYPPDDARTNAHENFRCAVEFIKNGVGKGVFVCYKNDNESATNIHIPSKILSHGECDANLFTIDKKPCAVYENGCFKINETGKSKVSYKSVRLTDDPKILVISSQPGDGFSYSLENVNAVIIKPYHSATLATANENLKRFCVKAKEKNIPVYVVNVKEGINYESTKEFEKLGIVPYCYGTFVAAYMDIWYKLS